MQQDRDMALSGNTSGRLSGIRLDWMSAYAYALLCVGCYLSYLGAPPLSILAIGGLLALSNIAKSNGQKASPIEIGVHLAVALIFALLAHIVGWGIAGAIGT